MSTTAQDRRAALRQRIESLSPADPLEASHRERMLDLLDMAGDPFDRNHFSPGHFTASAFIIDPSRSSLLLILHGKLGKWLQPGGHVEPDDADLAAAAARELAEETGLTDLSPTSQVPFDLDVHDLPAYNGQPPHAHFDVRYLFVAPLSGAVAGSDARDLRFVPLRELQQAGGDASVLRAVEKLLRTEG